MSAKRSSAPMLAFERLAQRVFGRFSPRFGPIPDSAGYERWKTAFEQNPEKFARKGRFGSEEAYELRTDLALELAEAGNFGPWIALCESGAPIVSERLKKDNWALNSWIEALAGKTAPKEVFRALAVANFDPFLGAAPRSALNWLGLCATQDFDGLEKDARVRRWVADLGLRMLKETPKSAQPSDVEEHMFHIACYAYNSLARGLAVAQPQRAGDLVLWLGRSMERSPQGRAVSMGALAFSIATKTPGSDDTLASVMRALAPTLREQPECFWVGCGLASQETALFIDGPGWATTGLDGAAFSALARVAQQAASLTGWASIEKSAPPQIAQRLRAFLEADALRAAVAEASAERGGASESSSGQFTSTPAVSSRGARRL